MALLKRDLIIENVYIPRVPLILTPKVIDLKAFCGSLALVEVPGSLLLKETTGGEFRVYRASIRLLVYKVYRHSVSLL